MSDSVSQLLPCNIADCGGVAPPPEPVRGPKQAQVVDYLAKDYDSFLRAMLDLLPTRVPGWRDRTEADLGMAILELFAFVGDQLSYYQDRVANEAYLGTAVQHDSVRKLLSLIDYRPDPGSAARVVLSFEVAAAKYLPPGFQARTRSAGDGEVVIFETMAGRALHPLLNSVALKSEAPIDPDGRRAVLDAELDEDLLPVGSLLLFESGSQGEWNAIAAPVEVDTTAGTTTVTLQQPLGARYGTDALVRANAVLATHGVTRVQGAAGTGLPGQAIGLEFAPLTYLGLGSGPRQSSLRVEVDGVGWHQVEDFIDSQPADRHYRLARDNDGFVTVHFGDGTRGMRPEAEAQIVVTYRTGIGRAGLVAANTLTVFDDPEALIRSCTNPLPSRGAAEPEPVATAKLIGPRQLRRPNRAVTPEDYEQVLLDGVDVGGRRIRPLHARAYFTWSGSWMTVAVAVDPPGRRPLSEQEDFRAALETALAAKKLAGSDVRVEEAGYAPLSIAVLVQVRPGHFARHVRTQIERMLGNREYADGSAGFFAPTRFGFGQDVYLSDLYAAAMTVEGVESLRVTRFKRLGDRYPDREALGFIPVGPLEIARCDSDLDHPENGMLFIRTCGGKEG